MIQDLDKIANQMIDGYAENPCMAKIDSYTQPNREVIIEILDRLQKLIFPGFFEAKHLRSEIMPHYAGGILEEISYHLGKQLLKAFRCTNCFAGASGDELADRAEQICLAFLNKLPKVQRFLQTDVEAAYDGDPAAYSRDEIIYSYPGLKAIMVYRIAHELFLLNVPLVPRIMTEYAHSVTGIDIHPGASIGEYFCIDHGTGIVIGETTVIGRHVKIYQGVTLGGLSTSSGQNMRGKKRHPNIGDHVTIYSGASILGGDTTVGAHAVIGGNAFITSSVDPYTKVIPRLTDLNRFREEGDKPFVYTI